MEGTWKPQGKAPVLLVRFNWKRLSANASSITTPAPRRVELCLRLHPGSIQQPQVLDYLRALKRHPPGRKPFSLWDCLPAHRGSDLQGYLRQEAYWLSMGYLPFYAPEFTPAE